MKKLIFLLIIIIGIFIGNYFLTEFHIKKVESTLNNLQKKLSDNGITLGISKIESRGKFFWDIELQGEAEVYMTASDCILYFYIPNFDIHSLIKTSQEVMVKMIFPKEITGHLDLNPEVAAKMNFEEKYKVFLKSNNIPIANIDKESFNGNGTFNLNLEQVVIDVEGRKSRDKLIFMENVNVATTDLSSDEMKLNANINNLNIYLDEERFGKNLPKTISFDDGSKNIEWVLDLLITDKTIDGGLETIYNGKMDCITRAFEIKVDGEDKATKLKNARKTHKSDLNFNVKNFDVFMDYSTSLMLNNKETELEKSQLMKVSDLFRKSVKENARQDGDITSFRIKDTDDKQTLFEGKPIEKVFEEPIAKLKEYS